MSNEHTPTGGEGVSTDCGSSVPDERTRTGEALDVLFEALADERRRCILAYLDGREEDVAAFSDLVDHVAAEVEEVTDERERVVVGLHHAHLPKLADAGLVDFDARSGHVRYRGGPAVSDWLALARMYGWNAPTA